MTQTGDRHGPPCFKFLVMVVKNDERWRFRGGCRLGRKLEREPEAAEAEGGPQGGTVHPGRSDSEFESSRARYAARSTA